MDHLPRAMARIAVCGTERGPAKRPAGEQFSDEISQFVPLVSIGAGSSAFYPAKLYTPLAARL
jgi:hypothetical protein